MRRPEEFDTMGEMRKEAPRVGRKEVLGALLKLKDQGIDNLQDMDNPDVLQAFELFKLWADETEAEEDLQSKLIGYLDQYAIGLEADWVNDKKELKEMDKNIASQLEQVGDENVPEFKKRVEYYRNKISEKLGK